MQVAIMAQKKEADAKIAELDAKIDMLDAKIAANAANLAAIKAGRLDLVKNLPTSLRAKFAKVCAVHRELNELRAYDARKLGVNFNIRKP